MLFVYYILHTKHSIKLHLHSLSSQNGLYNFQSISLSADPHTSSILRMHHESTSVNNTTRTLMINLLIIICKSKIYDPTQSESLYLFCLSYIDMLWCWSCLGLCLCQTTSHSVMSLNVSHSCSWWGCLCLWCYVLNVITSAWWEKAPFCPTMCPRYWCFTYSSSLLWMVLLLQIWCMQWYCLTFSYSLCLTKCVFRLDALPWPAALHITNVTEGATTVKLILIN